MKSGKRAWMWVAIGTGAAALLVYLNRGDQSEPPTQEAETPAEEPMPPRQEVFVEEPAPAPSLAQPPIAMSVRPATSAVATPDNGRPPCTSDDQCHGPRHAPCIEIKCVSGKCVYDESRCQCVSNEDCDDDDPCTRNHCFASTQKCIYIPIDDCKI